MYVGLFMCWYLSLEDEFLDVLLIFLNWECWGTACFSNYRHLPLTTGPKMDQKHKYRMVDTEPVKFSGSVLWGKLASSLDSKGLGHACSYPQEP